MGSVVGDVADAVGLGSRKKAIDASTAEAATNRDWQTQMWERQYGTVNDAMVDYMNKMFSGQKIAETPYQQQYKANMRQEIDSGMRPGEEGARNALMDRVRANPQGMSTQAYSKSLGNLVKEGSAARGTAYRKGMGEAQMLPFSMGMSFLNRTPYKPDSANYMPNYTSSFDPNVANLYGAGLNEIINQGSKLYSKYFGSTPDYSSITDSPDYSNYGDMSYDDINFGTT